MKKKIIIAVLALAVLAAVAVFVAKASDPYRLRAEPRREWKDRAVADIARRSGDRAWVATEIAALKAQGTPDKSDVGGWLSPQLILMTNGAWIAYTNVCTKQDNRIHDLFIGRSSDGQWYYSTYHFCIGMLVLRMDGEVDGQPESVPKFADKYYLRKFDGQSDECLRKTWPPQSK